MSSGLIIGGIDIPLYAALDLRQTYEKFGGFSRRRMADGRATSQWRWQKLRTTIQAGGWIATVLEGLDFSQSMTLSCVAPRSKVSADTAITIPAARRSDSGWTPVGWGLVGDEWVETAVAMVVDTANLTPVTGATLYRVSWYPLLTVFANPPAEDLSTQDAAYSWTLTAEEV